MRNNQSTNQNAAQSCSFTFDNNGGKRANDAFRGKDCSKNNSLLESTYGGSG